MAFYEKGFMQFHWDYAHGKKLSCNIQPLIMATNRGIWQYFLAGSTIEACCIQLFSGHGMKKVTVKFALY